MRTLLISALVCVALHLGCCPADQDGYFGTTERSSRDWATFYVNNYDEPETLDPGLATDRAATTLLNELFEGLTVLHPEDMHPTPGVAERWDRSDDNRRFRFHLRKNARWSDGQPVTAADFLYAWRRVLAPGSSARMATMLYRLKNGKLYHQGKLFQLERELRLRRRAATAGMPVEELAAGRAVQVMMTSRVEIASGIQPLMRPVEGVTEITFKKAPKKKPEAARLIRGKDGPTLAPAVPGWTGPSSARVVAHGLAVRCNGRADFWYELNLGSQGGFLPGCALRWKLEGADWVLVRPYDQAPTFAPAVEAAGEPTGGAPAVEPTGEGDDEPKRDPAPVGWVPGPTLGAAPELLGVRATDDHTLEVELGEPTPYFLELLSYPTFFPVRQDLIERFAEAGQPDRWYRPEHIVVNGPYTLESWRFRYEIRMKQNPHYHGRDALRLQRIVWLEVADHHANMNLYKTGEIDFIGSNVSLPAAYMAPLSKLHDFRRNRYLATYFYELNVAEPPLDDVRVRRALNLALDKQLLIDTVTRSDQLPATHIVPDYAGSGYAAAAKADREAGRDPFAGPGFEFDPARARQLLKDAGYEVTADGDRFRTQGFGPLEILYNTSEGHRKIAVAVQDMWKRHLGITVSLRNEEWKVMLKNMQGGRYQVARFSWTADYNHPHSFLETLLSYSPQNWSNWKSQSFDETVERAAATADRSASIALYRQAEAIAVEEMPLVPLYFYTKSTMVKPYVKGFYENPKNEHLVRFMWLDPDWRRQPDNAPAHAIAEFPPPGEF